MDWTKESDVLKALLALFERQTEDEKVSTTKYDNGVGFNAVDAPFLSDLSRTLIAYRKPISRAQFNTARLILRKYERQLSEIDLDSFDLPPTATVYENKKNKSDGTLTVVSGELRFYPKIYPSDGIKNLNFHGAKDINGSFYWHGKLNYSNVTGVIRMFPNLERSTELDAWENELLSLNVLDSLGSTSLLDQQKLSTSFLVKHRRALLGLAPGLGKTVCSLMAASELGGNTLIVCPLTLTRNWRNEIWKWLKKPSAIWHQNYGPLPYEFVITNYDTAVNYLDEYIDLEFDNLILDESILLKNRHRKEVKDESGKSHWEFTTIRVEAMNKLAKSVNNVFLLSGSPTSKFYDDMWSQLHILDSTRFGSYWKFAERYCIVEKPKWGWKITGNKPDSDKMLINDLQDIYFCRTQDQVTDLPDWIFDDIEIAMLPEQSKLYKKMEESFMATLPAGDTVVASNVLSQMVRLIQIASNPMLIDGSPKSNFCAKWEAVPELLEFEKLPAIVWTTFIKTAEYMTKLLESKGYKVGTLTGSTEESQRQQTVDDFQNGYLDVVVAHPGVGKFGLTLTAGRTAIYLERGYNGDDYYQSLHRIRRIGTKHSPHVIHLLSVLPEGRAKTIDHVIGDVLKFRKDSSISLTTGLIREILK